MSFSLGTRAQPMAKKLSTKKHWPLSLSLSVTLSGCVCVSHLTNYPVEWLRNTTRATTIPVPIVYV